MRRTSGFTTVELIVVLLIAGVLALLGVRGYRNWMVQSQYSDAIRKVTLAINTARIRAMQSQTTVRLVIRPQQYTPVWPCRSDSTPPCNSVTYLVGDIVTHGPLAYRCISGHNTSNSTTEPAVGANWKTYWEIISDYQYAILRLPIVPQPHVKLCTGGTVNTLTNCTDTFQYQGTDSTSIQYNSIQFNWLGFPTDYVDHCIWLYDDINADSVSPLYVWVTSQGRIRHFGEQYEAQQ